MKEYTLQISGMSCGHCVRTVHAALKTIRNVSILEVAVGHARIRCPADSLADVARVVKEEGFEVSRPAA